MGWTKPNDRLASWDDTKIKATNFNNRVLISLFSVVINEEFKRIPFVDSLKEAWTILQNTYEGTKTVKNSKL